MPPVVTFFVGIVLLVLFGWYFATNEESRKRVLGSVLTLLTTALAIYAFVPPQERIQLGIDLKGGTSFLLKLRPSETNPKPITPDSLDRAMEAIRKRVDAQGTAEPVIAPAPPDRIMVQLPGLDPVRIEGYREALKKVAKLEFRMVHVDSDRLVEQRKTNPNAFLDPGYEIVPYVHRREGKEIQDQIVVSKKVEITGDKVSDAGPTLDNAGNWQISLGFNSEGKEQFADVTGRMAAAGKRGEYMRFAILMDKVCISAAGLKQDAIEAGGISGGSALISGDFEEKEARDVSSALLNPLENPISIEEERSTSSTLGQDAINSGLLAGGIGAGLTLLVTLLYYRFAGLVANIALFVLLALLFGAMGMFGVVLTLPGIAGILLTLGMAIDANVLIYERLREEQAAGKSLKASLDAAYDKAFSAIFDSNITTLLTAALLYWKATGPVQGFAVSLMIGILASMFTALTVTRNLFAWGIHSGFIKKITMSSLIPATKFDFLGKRKAAWWASIIVMVACTVIFVMRGEKNFGVDFKGGDRLVMQAGGPQPSLDAVRQSLAAIGYDDAVVQIERSAQGEFLVVRDRADSAGKISETLVTKFPEAKFSELSRETVGAVVGNQLATNSAVALALGMIGIAIYVALRFEVSFSMGVLIGLVHDLIITIGLYALMGREISLVTVGAILTIAGYSVNDTIVVFDRIREDLKAGRPGGIIQVMNGSINATLSRTILTGGTVVLTTIVLYFFGGPVLNDFALAMLIGVLIGTYSSIFIAAPIVLWWSGRGGRDLKSEVKRSDEQPAVPA